MKVVLMGYILGIAMEKMGTRSVDEKPDDLPDEDDEEALRMYKKQLVDRVMELAWNPPDIRQVLSSKSKN